MALRNIALVVQKRPGILANDIKVFFCKYKYPIYVKMKKLETMLKTSTPDLSIEQTGWCNALLTEISQITIEIFLENPPTVSDSE